MKYSNRKIMQATLYTTTIQKFRFQINHNIRYKKKYKLANNLKDTKKNKKTNTLRTKMKGKKRHNQKASHRLNSEL